LPGIKQVKSPSLRMGFLRFSGPATVPACLPGGAALTGATRSVARTRCAAPPPGKHPARPAGSLTSVIPITLIGYPVIVLINYMDYLPCVMNQRIISPKGEK
ncbi:hypothetical protein B6I40_25845, partial [Klebsiella variicola]